ncbi:MAG: 16S rRNA (cytosine(967)-C(5))-methyltransferase RsmB, partial [Gemmatimonadota bacterium]|nr:16S rRNA (cytosine(967)-C(5))-methyltransferase RsmB [Gemmatimonadota bacterium]
PVQRALRLGAFQLLYMDSVPAYAAVSEAVGMVRASRSRAAAGLVNAVLRRIGELSEPQDLFPHPDDDLLGFLTSWGSHPEWLVARWLDAFGPDETRALVQANNREPGVFLHPLSGTVSEALQVLEEAGLVAHPEAGLLRLAPGVDPAGALATVPGVIQDPAAALVTRFVSPPDGSFVADVCAAPGGKALALGWPKASGSAVRGVLAGDLSRVRLRRMVRAVQRLRVPVWPVVMDARHPPIAQAQVVLIDAPCSGTGTLRRHPDARWRVVPQDIVTLCSLQEAILEGCAPLVPTGGLLVYATCTLEDEENVSQLYRFLERHPGFRLDPGPAPSRFLDDRGFLAVTPQRSGHDGAFAARLRRVD